MLVMEYMDYGSLHDLLNNETMLLSGEIILQMMRDVSRLRCGVCLSSQCTSSFQNMTSDLHR